MSTLKTNTLSNVAGTASTAIENAINGSAKAWVNFNGTGTVAINGSYNISSITDNGTGDYTVNFTNAMSNANYSALVSTDTWAIRVVSTATASVRVANFVTLSGAAVDNTLATAAIFS